MIILISKKEYHAIVFSFHILFYMHQQKNKNIRAYTELMMCSSHESKVTIFLVKFKSWTLLFTNQWNLTGAALANFKMNLNIFNFMEVNDSKNHNIGK